MCKKIRRFEHFFKHVIPGFGAMTEEGRYGRRFWEDDREVKYMEEQGSVEVNSELRREQSRNEPRPLSCDVADSNRRHRQRNGATHALREASLPQGDEQQDYSCELRALPFSVEAVKSAIRLAHDHTRDIKIGHLPCVYIRVNCRSRGAGGVSLHELIPVGIPAKGIGRCMGPSMEHLTLKSTERLLFGPSLEMSHGPVCPPAVIERLVLPPSYLRPIADDGPRTYIDALPRSPAGGKHVVRRRPGARDSAHETGVYMPWRGSTPVSSRPGSRGFPAACEGYRESWQRSDLEHNEGTRAQLETRRGEDLRGPPYESGYASGYDTVSVPSGRPGTGEGNDRHQQRTPLALLSGRARELLRSTGKRGRARLYGH